MAEFSVAGLTYQNLAQKGNKDDQGVWRYTDPLDNSDYGYNPVSGKSQYKSGTYKDLESDPSWIGNAGKSWYTGSGSSNNSNLGNSTTLSSNSLFGTGGYLGTGVSFDDYVNKMKDLTDWRLGIDKRSMENAYGFRNQEATRDYGFQTGLAGQQIQGQKDIQGQQIEGTKNLETLRNEYMNKRQTEQLTNQRAMQEAGFGQQNKLLSDNANRARSLYFGAGGM